MKKAIIHIGSEKTGASHIQDFLYNNRSLLYEHGIFYPVVGCARNHTELALNFSDIVDDFPNFTREFGEIYCANLKSEIESAPEGKTILLSSEHFHSRCTGHNIQGLYNQLLDFGLNVENVVLYFRDQASSAISGYSTSVLCGNRSDFDISQITPSNYYFNYELSASCWGDVFKNENMNIRSYNFLPEEGLLFDFLLSIGVSREECLLILERSEINSERSHEKIDPPKLDIIKLMSCDNIGIEDDFIRILKHTNIESNYSYYDLSDVIFLKSIFDPINDKLCRKFNLDVSKFPSITIEEVKKAHLSGKGEISVLDLSKVMSTMWSRLNDANVVKSIPIVDESLLLEVNDGGDFEEILTCHSEKFLHLEATSAREEGAEACEEPFSLRQII